MNKLNIYLFILSSKYIFINLLIILFLVIFLNLIELSRVLINNENNQLLNYIYLTILKLPTILGEILPFVTIIGISFLFRNLINNNELISMRNIGYSIFDIFIPIAISVFIISIFFLIILNPLSANFENKYENIINKKDHNLYSIKVTDNEMWIKNIIDKNNSSFIKIKNINLKNMIAKEIQILMIKDKINNFILAKNGKFIDNNFILNDVKIFNVTKEKFEMYDNFSLKINFNKNNIINSITDYKLIPYYKYLNHTKTLKKFNLYSPEIGLFYMSEVLKPIFIVMLAFVVVGISGKFRRNENFFKVLFFAILTGFLIFFLREITTKLTLTLNINYIISYLIIFFIPFIIGLYLIINIEND